jgi:uncharacterized protein involved in response to NO
MGLLAVPGWAGVGLALDVVMFILAVMAGRVIPMFTNNGVPGAGAQRHAALEKLALGSVLAVLAADAAGLRGATLVALLSVAATAHAARWAAWRPWRTLGNPLVWVLHLAYAWLVLHLALRAGAAAGLVASSIATHALTLGAIGGLVIGMMSRTGRGHTGRPLRADRWDVAAFACVAFAAAVRVGLPALSPGLWRQAVGLSAVLWSTGFAIYLLREGRWLLGPRVDGRPG